jgi:hypothetical protein
LKRHLVSAFLHIHLDVNEQEDDTALCQKEFSHSVLPSSVPEKLDMLLWCGLFTNRDKGKAPDHTVNPRSLPYIF